MRHRLVQVGEKEQLFFVYSSFGTGYESCQTAGLCSHDVIESNHLHLNQSSSDYVLFDPVFLS